MSISPAPFVVALLVATCNFGCRTTPAQSHAGTGRSHFDAPGAAVQANVSPAPSAVVLANAANTPVGASFEGIASWYGPGFAGRPTASGEPFDPAAATCAHRTLPFGTRLRVTRIDGTAAGASIELLVNDRGPHVDGRILDVSQSAAQRLGLVRDGLGRVRAEILTHP
jgi:rare lipoprotein A